MPANGVRLPRKPKGERPRYFDDPTTDKLVTMLMSLAGEMAVLHDRHDTLERVMVQRGLIGADAIEAYRPTQADIAERDRWREAFLGEILRVLQQDLEMLERETPQPYQAALDIVNS